MASQQVEAESQVELESDITDDSDFTDVLGTLDKGELIILAEDIARRECAGAQALSSIVSLGSPLFGSDHAVYPLCIDDVPRWAAKIPRDGTVGQWDEERSSMMMSEVRTMQLLRRETTIPVPTVIEFSCTTENRIRCPFIVMSFVSGLSLYDVWHGHRLRGVSKEEVWMHRKRALDGIAAAMVQLNQFSFTHGGYPSFCDDGKLLGVKGDVSNDSSDNGRQDVDSGFSSTVSSYYSRAVTWDQSADSETRSFAKLIRLFLECIPEPSQVDPFVLKHPEVNIQNFIVSSDGYLRGIIDWAYVEAVPRSCGNETYPLWLIRDWFPTIYWYEESMDRGIYPNGCWEDSPDCLKYFRDVYLQVLAKHLSRTGVERKPSICAISHITRNLVLAANDKFGAFEVLEKILEEMRAVSPESGLPIKDADVLHLLNNDNCADSIIHELKRSFECLLTRQLS